MLLPSIASTDVSEEWTEQSSKPTAHRLAPRPLAKCERLIQLSAVPEDSRTPRDQSCVSAQRFADRRLVQPGTAFEVEVMDQG